MPNYKKMTKRSLTSEMDHSVKRMLKLIEGDGDSFAKKADMYYQKRPELISHVEDFYRMYRSLAERYNHVTGELRKNIPPELQSQSSGISDAGSEQNSPRPTPDRRFSRRRYHRAAGFDFFLGSTVGGSYDLTQKDVEDSSSAWSDSESDSDDSYSINNYSIPSVNGDSEGMLRRIIELEIELREAKERLRESEEGSKDGSNSNNNRNYERMVRRLAGYEEQLRIANGKLKLAEGEIVRLRREFGNEESMKLARNSQAQLELAQKDIPMVETENQSGERLSSDLQEQIAGWEASVSPLDSGLLFEKLKITYRRLRDKEDEIARLKLELENRQSSAEETDGSVFEMPEVVSEKSQEPELLKQIAGLEACVLSRDRDIEVLEQKLRITEESLEGSEKEIARLKLELENRRSSADETEGSVCEMPEVVLEKSQEPELLKRIAGLEACVLSRDRDIEVLEQKLRITEESLEGSEKEIARLVRESKEATSNIQVELQAAQADIAMREVALGSERRQVSELQERIKKYKFDVLNLDKGMKELKEELSHTTLSFSVEKGRLQAEISKLTEERAMLEEKLGGCATGGLSLPEEMEQLKSSIAQREDDVEALNKDLDALKLRYDILLAERDGLKAKVETLMAEVSCRDDRIQKMDEHLNSLHTEQMELVTKAERGRKLVKELEEEVERQRMVISSGAEEKREAIRQLCFSLEHYRTGYQQLRRSFMGNQKRHHTVLASH